MAKRKQRRRISIGTWFILLLTVGTLGACALLLPALTGPVTDIQVNTEVLLDALSSAVTLPGRQGEPSPTSQAGLTAAEPEASPVAAATPAPTPAPRKVTICAVGSIFGARDIRQSGYDKESKSYLYNDIFEQMRPYLETADMTICTSEAVYAGEDAGYSDYNLPDAMLDALRYVGIDMISLGNEHALSKGLDGLRATIQAMESKGFLITGVDPELAELGASPVFQINGIQIAVLGYTGSLSNESQSRVKKKADRAVIPMLETERVKSDIAAARKSGADLVIVIPHWGTKNSAKITTEQKKLAEQLTASGADLVLGAHPNVLQRIERQQAQQADGSIRDALVAYSLGSFLTNVRDTANSAGVVLRIEVEMDPDTRKVRIASCTYAPTWVSRVRNAEGSGYTYRILRADDEDSAAGLDDQSLKSLEAAAEFVEKTLADSAAQKML